MKQLPKGFKYKIVKSCQSYDYPYTVIIYDSNEVIKSHYYKTGWWGGMTLQEAKDKALKELGGIK